MLLKLPSMEDQSCKLKIRFPKLEANEGISGRFKQKAKYIIMLIYHRYTSHTRDTKEP